jgi:hypothetical protein
MNTQLEPLSEQLRQLECKAPEPTMSAQKIQEAKARHKAELDMLYRMAAVIDDLPYCIARKVSIYNDYLDFNGLTREESVTVMLALNAGKWTKSANVCSPDTIDYNAEIDGMKVRLWAAAPPDSCRVIEVEEEVPATKIVRRKLICSGPEV